MTAALPLLLRSHPHLTTASAESRDFQARVGHPAATDPAPCVLVLTRAADREIDELSLWLAARGIALVRLDSDRCADTDVQWDPFAGLLTRDGQTFRPRVCWLRYFDVDALRTAQTTPDAVQHVRDQWQALVAALAAHPGLHTLNSGARPGTPDRLTQLAAARAAGLRVPATLVTTRLDVAARALPGPGDLLVKSLGRHCVEPQPGRLRGVYPQRVSRASLDGEHRTGAPVLVQEYVAADRELRIHAVGGTLIGYAVTRPTPRVAVDPAGVDHRAALRHSRRRGRIAADAPRPVPARPRRLRPARHARRPGVSRGQPRIRLALDRTRRR
ncbi:hypothetical protein [Rhodococcus sp. M8-33]|uniref:hypothetical protein n=1 Tax=Rhodococcus sp. M8-33 TaxID=3058377 RepID=UPI002ED303C8